jgi:hypothetical protein
MIEITVCMVVFSILTVFLAGKNLQLIKNRNMAEDRARSSEYTLGLFKKRMNELEHENKMAFSVYMSHLPVHVIVETLASMGAGPVRIRNFTRESEWYQVAISPKYRHLFDEDDLKALGKQKVQEVLVS